MDFNLSREHLLVRKMMAEFTENEVKPIAAETDAKSEYPRENIEKLFDLGVMGMCVPKEYGGAGADPHLEREVGIVHEIAAEQNLKFKLAVISSEFTKEYLVDAVKAGKTAKLGPAPEITEEEILASSHIVAQMGIEPIIAALEAA